ncbi:hypothetical protein D3C80_1950670 [compost metagenome]
MQCVLLGPQHIQPAFFDPPGNLQQQSKEIGHAQPFTFQQMTEHFAAGHSIFQCDLQVNLP